MTIGIRIANGFSAFVIAVVFGLPAVAQDAAGYPNRAIRVIVPYAAGGLQDSMARIIGPRLNAQLGQPIMIENRGGAGGISGCEAVAKAAPDGYTLLVAGVGQLAINPALYAKLPYDPVKDFAPVSVMGTSTIYVVAAESTGIATFADMVAQAKARPGQLNYGSSGIGSLHHLTMETLKAALGLDIVHVPFKGTGQMLPALLGGQLTLGLSSLPSLAPYIRSGRVKLLAINVGKRSTQEPDVPTIAELGIPGFDFPSPIGLLAPAGTPPAVVAKLAAEVAKAVHLPDTVRRFNAIGVDSVGSSSEVYAAMIRGDLEKYAKAVRISRARVD